MNTPAITPLVHLIRSQIETSGPMSVARYMQLCLAHPQHGYYQKADPLGTAGDFTTAPEVSQLFGELIGVWLLQAWVNLGKPSPCALIELGPGRGTLMADIVRTASIDPSFHGALRVHLLETSTVLRARQVQSLARLGVTPTHHADLAALPELPSLWVANEFFDALPADQWMRTPNGWNARKVGLDPYNALVFGVDPTPYPAPKPFSFDPPLGTIIEHSPAQDSMVCAVAMHAARNTGAGLIIDYGSLETGTGDTLQAVRAHAKADPLADPGLADLTTHVDFAHLARTAQSAAPVTVGSAQQGAFLLTMGLLERAGHLGANALPDVQDAISLAVERLAGDAAMGKLFKVMGFAYPHFPMPGLNAHPQTARGAT